MKGSKFNLSLKPIVLGAVFGIVVCFLMICLACFLLVGSRVLSESLLNFLSLAILSVSSFGSGFMSGYISKSRGLIYGFFCGSFLLILFTIASLAFSKLDFTYFFLVKSGLVLAAGLIGGVVGVNKRA